MFKALFHHFNLKAPRNRDSHFTEKLLRRLKKLKPELHIPSDILYLCYKLDYIEYTNNHGQKVSCETAIQTEYGDSPKLGRRALHEVFNEAQAKERIVAARKIKDWAEQIMDSVKYSTL